MNKAIVLIDGENFIKKVEEILKEESKKLSSGKIYDIQLKKLILKVFKSSKNIDIADINYYSAKLRVYSKTRRKSYQLIASQRHLKNTLEKQGINFVIAGNVRPQEDKDSSGKIIKVTFKEKGVDVRIAVDMVTLAYDGKYDTIVLCSSDSDIQPAVAAVKRKGIKVVYLGFSINPNKGLMFTTNKSVLFRNPEIVKSVK